MKSISSFIVTILYYYTILRQQVIVGLVDSCMRHIIAHSRFPRQLKEVGNDVSVCLFAWEVDKFVKNWQFYLSPLTVALKRG